MWLSDDNPNYEDDCPSEQSKEKPKFRSNSPPFEGGESLCDFFVEQAEQNERLKSLRLGPENAPEGFLSFTPKLQSEDVFHCTGEEKFNARNFISLLNQDLLPTNAFTQTFLQSILSSVENKDPVVANAWMETLLDVIDLLPKEIVKGEILNLAVNKGQLSQPVSSRLLCCKMLGKICMKFDPYVIKKEVLPVVLSLCQDVDFEVRGYMCRQLDIIAKGIGLEATKSAILPELVELANDEETFVRLAGIETVVQMLPLLDDETCTQAIIPLVKKFCENSLSVKDSTLPVVSKQLGRLCCGLASNFSVQQKTWFLNFFRELAKLGLNHQGKDAARHLGPMPDLLPEVDHKDRYRECRCACAYNFPAMVLFASQENFENELYKTFKELCSDPFQNVRRTMASGFYEIARMLGSKSCLLLPELVHLLKDNSTEVLKGVVPHLPETLKAVCSRIQSPIDIKEESESELVKALIACEEATSVTSNWRLHADFLNRLSCLPYCVSSETIFTTFVPLLFMKLHTARPIPCRIASAYSLLVFLRSTPNLERRKGIINELIREFCHGKSCHKRMLFIQVCELVIELFSKAFFKLYFFKPLLELSGDSVPNIRLRLCSTLPRLKSLLKLPKDGVLLQQLESSVKRLMTDEKDRDVSCAVSKAIEELDKIEVATEQVSRRLSCIEMVMHDPEDHLKEKQERQLLEMEFNLTVPKDDDNSKCPVTTNNANKQAKIPVMKSGTLPKQTKGKDVYRESARHLAFSPSKSLRSIKQERRISSPGLNIDFHKTGRYFHVPKENIITTSQTFGITSSRSIPNFRSQSPIVRTWPRQKRVSGIPKHTIDRCPSPMPPPRRFSEQNIEILKNQSNILTRASGDGQTDIPSKPGKHGKNLASVSTSSPEVRRKTNTTPLPSPEITRRQVTNATSDTESKIPTPNLKKKSNHKEM